MISIDEIELDQINTFWDEHIRYLVEDEIICDDDFEYFISDEYRGVIAQHIMRNFDKHHLIYFIEDGRKIGACSYCIYQSEEGKCFILDFWVFPEFRGNGMGHRCFKTLEDYTKAEGATYYELNSAKENSIRFWLSNGFVENGTDEYGEKLFIKK
ncbi:MAG: GNAT family N-acetyltransferase [Clostridia bacterium]|nr:GNAT family N-acetyltransferase [Clostridia bacterium]